jgi:hypothetical protein
MSCELIWHAAFYRAGYYFCAVNTGRIFMHAQSGTSKSYQRAMLAQLDSSKMESLSSRALIDISAFKEEVASPRKLP